MNEAPIKKRHPLLLIGKIVISLGLMGWLLSMVEWSAFFHSISNANPWLISLGVVFFITNLLLLILRWNVALTYFGIEESKGSLYRLNMIGTFFNNFLPSTVGGDGYKYLALSKKHPTKKKEILSSLVFDRASGFLTLFLINILLLPFYASLVVSNHAFLLLEGITLGIFLGILLVYFLRNHLAAWLDKVSIKFVRKVIETFQLVFGLNRPEIAKPVLLYSTLFVFVGALWQWSYILALGFDVNFLYLLFAFSIIQIAGIIPISLNSIGISESLSVLLLGFAGVPLEVALASALAVRIMLMLLSLSGGITYLLKR
jgi:hypothetical protein